MDMQIAKITHYYDKIGVAVIEVTNQKLKTGDRVRISGHDHEHEQTVESLQVEHEKVSEVSRGDTAGMKVDQPVKPGDTVFLIGK